VPEDERRSGRLREYAHEREELERGGNLPHVLVIGRFRLIVEAFVACGGTVGELADGPARGVRRERAPSDRRSTMAVP